MIDDIDKIEKSEADWQAELPPEVYHVTRCQGTEPAFTGAYWDLKADGTYACRCCEAPLFSSQHKYDSGSGWPSFDAPIADAPISERLDRSHGMARTEVSCEACGAHLGHVFTDGPRDTTGLRYCINSASLHFVPDGEG